MRVYTATAGTLPAPTAAGPNKTIAELKYECNSHIIGRQLRGPPMTLTANPNAWGPFEGAVPRWFFKRATIGPVERLSQRFRLIGFAGAAFERPWAVGSKVQVAFG